MIHVFALIGEAIVGWYLLIALVLLAMCVVRGVQHAAGFLRAKRRIA